MNYPAFPKIPRWFRDVTITEKIDGTNGQIEVLPCPNGNVPGEGGYVTVVISREVFGVRAGCRTRWITPSGDNHGFAAWVWDNAVSLVGLGAGLHSGEWWGHGIQRRYGLQHKYFSLFDVRKAELVAAISGVPELRVVPVLYQGLEVMGNGTSAVTECLRRLAFGGSVASPGFMQPEGVCIFHSASRGFFKATLDGDAAKGS